MRVLSVMFSTVTLSTSTLSPTGTKLVRAARTPAVFRVRSRVCHMKPAVRRLSSWAGVNFTACWAAEAPVRERAVPSAPTSQKFRVERLLCRFSTLTGSSRKVSWSSLASPPRSGETQLFSPASEASGKYSWLISSGRSSVKLPSASIK